MYVLITINERNDSPRPPATGGKGCKEGGPGGRKGRDDGKQDEENVPKRKKSVKNNMKVKNNMIEDQDKIYGWKMIKEKKY